MPDLAAAAAAAAPPCATQSLPIYLPLSPSRFFRVNLRRAIEKAAPLERGGAAGDDTVYGTPYTLVRTCGCRHHRSSDEISRGQSLGITTAAGICERSCGLAICDTPAFHSTGPAVLRRLFPLRLSSVTWTKITSMAARLPLRDKRTVYAAVPVTLPGMADPRPRPRPLVTGRCSERPISVRMSGR